MNNKQANVNRVAFFNILAPFLLNGLSFLTMALFTRLLGTEGYGYYTNYLSYLSILSVLIGFQAAGAIAPASVRYEGKKRDKCFSNIAMIALFSALLIGILMLVFAESLSSFTGFPKHMLAILFFHATGQFAVNFGTAKFAYEKRSTVSFLISVGISVTSIGLSLLLISTMPDNVPRYQSHSAAHAIPYILVGAVLILHFLLKGKSFFNHSYWKFTLALCLPLIFHQLSNTVLHQCDKIMLKRLGGENAVDLVGIYGFAVTFANIINIIWGALNTTFVPFYHDDIKFDQPDKLRQKVKNYLFLFTCITLGFIMAMPEVAKLFGDEPFWPSIELIPVLVLGYYFVFLYSFPVNFEFYHQRTRTIAIGTCLTAGTNIALNYVLIPLWGMTGAAVATLLSYAALWLFHLILARVSIKSEYHFKEKRFYLYLLFTVMGTALFYLIEDMWYIRWFLFLVLAAAVLYRLKKQRSIF